MNKNKINQKPQYEQMITSISCGYQAVQTKVLLGDYLWAQRNDGVLSMSLPVERRSVADLAGRSSSSVPQ